MARNFRVERYPFILAPKKNKANFNMVENELLVINYEEYLLKFVIMFTTIMMHYFIKDATSCSYIEETYCINHFLMAQNASIASHQSLFRASWRS